MPLLRLEPEHWRGSQWLSRGVKKEYEALFNFQHPSSAQRPSSKLETCSWERLKNVTHTPTYMNLPDWLSSPQTEGNHRDTRYYINSFTAVSSQILCLIWQMKLKCVYSNVHLCSQICKQHKYVRGFLAVSVRLLLRSGTFFPLTLIFLTFLCVLHVFISFWSEFAFH